MRYSIILLNTNMKYNNFTSSFYTQNGHKRIALNNP
jgi:hypothetical protein